MIERFTLDSLAAAILTQLKRATPDPKLARRFFKAGKRDGRRERSAEPTCAFLREGVEVAVSKVCEEFLAARRSLQEQLAAAQHTAEGDPGAVEQLPSSPEPQAVEKSSVESAGSSRTKSAQPLPLGARDADLEGSIGALRRAREAQEAQRIRAEAEQRRRAAEQAAAGVATLKTQLSELTEQFAQQVESCHRTGKFLWARYCSGYEVGSARRGSPDDSDGVSVPAIEFSEPDVLTEVTEMASAPSLPPAPSPLVPKEASAS